MDEKISIRAVEQYADAFVRQILDRFFSNKTRISGQEILSLSSIRQINLFVVKELFKVWRNELKKLESPYFNYQAPDVKEALGNFMDILSRNILVERTSFEPLFKKATIQCLLVILDPYDFFSVLVSGNNNTLEVEAFREELKYLKINKAPLERLLQRLDQQQVKEISGNEAFSILDQILEEVNFTPEDVEGYIASFSSVVPLQVEKFYQSAEPVINTPKASPQPVKVAPANKPVATVNERINAPAKPTLANNFQKISLIRDHLTINQKFMFTKVLFHGDFEAFSKIIDELDRSPSIEVAMRYLEGHVSEWDQESEEFHEFMELVEKRFH